MYSQNNEEEVILRLLGGEDKALHREENPRPRMFLDLGAHDDQTLSNTRLNSIFVRKAP